MTWSEIKIAITTIYGQYVGSGKIIDDTDNGSTPSPLAILVGLVHNRISGVPIELNCLKETGTITLTGATTYNLRTLLPGLKTVFQIYGINQNQEHPNYGNAEANITPLDGWTVRGDSLVFTGVAPTSGTVTIQYKSKYMVKNSAGTRQLYFLAEDDYSVLDDDDSNVLIFGVGEFLNWYSDSESQDRRKEVKDWFKEAWENLMLSNKVSRSLDSML